MKSRNIEDVYPLSPMQQGMLFHSLFAPGSGVYIGQITYELHGSLDISALERSWQQVIDRHPILRTAFVWENLEKSLQVVGRHVKLPLLHHDWRGLAPSQQQKQLEIFLQCDRHQDFELSKAPLIRLSLIQFSNEIYQLIVSHHHLVLDGWSLPLLFREVIAYYEAFRFGKKLSLERPHPYRNYIAWLQQQDIVQAQKFWQDYLQRFTTPTPLVVDKVADTLVNQNQTAAVQQMRLSAENTDALQSFARQHRLTINTIVQGVWALLLSRYSNEKDVVFGATSSGRPVDLVGSESIVGNLINTLPVRVNVDFDQLILPWLQQLQTQQIESRQYEYSPLVDIQGWSEIYRGVPLFESIIVFENYPTDASLQERAGDLKIRKTYSILETNYPLTISVGVFSEFYINILYNAHRFEVATITRMLGHLQTMLTSIIVNPKQHLADLPLLTEAERYQVLKEWNHTSAEYALDKCIHQLFAEQVERTPDAIAAVLAEQELTYQELNTKANQLAFYLQKLGVGADVLVGICVERSLEMVVGLLGILKAGGAYLPLDPNYPQERLEFMLNDADVSVLLTQERLVGLLPKQRQIVCLDKDWEVIAQQNSFTPENTVQPDNLAYVIYTSGSTGKPKGVTISHRSLCNHTLWMQAEFPLNESDRVLQKTAFSFDASVWEFYAPLLAGGQLILAKPGGQQDSAYLVELIAEQKITILQLVPSQLRVLLEEQKIQHCQSLRQVFCGGEVLAIDLQNKFFKLLPGVELCNLYGPTEATIDTTYFKCKYEDERPVVPIGSAIANVQIYILDSHLQPVPIGVRGEIYIGGAGLARGYLNRPDLTAEKFISNPFFAGTRLYKTGDLARYRPDGTVEFCDRIDGQIKLRGFRIELGEIEAQLRQHSAVKQAVVLVREDFPGEQRLVAYLIPIPNHAPTVSELRNFLKQNLPDYMIPTVFILLDTLPFLANGKIDRQALPAPDNARPDLQEVFVAPCTPIEETLVQIWSEVLRVEKVGIYDNFFELGGDSILSLQVIAKANQAGLQLTPKQIFEYQTIADLALVAGTNKKVETEQGIVTGFLPLTPIQHWFFEQELIDFHHWNQAVILEVNQTCEPILLKQVIQQLFIHHDALRLRFVQTEFGWQSNIAAPDQITPFSIIDLSTLPQTEQRQAIEAKATALQASLNLSDGPLLQIALFVLGENQPDRLLIIIHHLAVDGVSWRILLEDIQTAYQQLSHGKKIQLPAKTTSVKQWSKKLQEYANLETVHSEVNYWLSQSNKHISPLPTDYPADKNTVASACTVSVTLTQEETESLLSEVPAAYQTQINDILLTALVQTFQQWTGKSSLLVNLEGHGREDLLENVDLSNTVGWFTTIFPVLLDITAVFDPGDALKAIKEQLRSIPHRGINYGVLRYLSQQPIAKQLQALPQAEVTFNYLGQFDQVISESSMFRPAAESTGQTQSPKGNRNSLLEVNGLIVGGQLRLNWTYSKALHQQTTVEKLAQGYIEKLQQLIAHCQSPTSGGYTPSDFSQMRLNQEELDQLIAELD
ncbi:non-ribosomal peptide synthase/amino acid adenylation enzyme [Cylindrospermum stagnale PCC 7417]|uniref:Non-ribosomal peptide synthase/amino acid adenylation enzyme n=1 Tax=Cylindrospermum stagnale PCC 7417 TaxID=56107 RepID=K9WTV2_9NOST|nr:non-ribosomal peptide synthetase [Cylindrospermum stagnale]AFZ23815.1 non-ribosomal peptide synthase/amino acid adenylation enzyme [Cylindrospermum stagnale PCC 7417]